MVTMSLIAFIISQILSIVYNFTIYIKSRFSFDYHSKKGRAGDLLQKIKLILRKLQRPKSWEQNLGWKSTVCFSGHLTFSGMWEVCWLLLILQRAGLQGSCPGGGDGWWALTGPEESVSDREHSAVSRVHGLAIDFLPDLSLLSYQQLPVLNRRK